MPSLLVVNARDKDARTLIGRLRKGGYISVMCENCGEAFELLEWMFFHLALFDFSPSDEDDLMMELVRSLRTSDPTIPIIAIPLTPDDPRRPALEALHIRIVDAPVSLPEILQLAQEILASDPYNRD